MSNATVPMPERFSGAPHDDEPQLENECRRFHRNCVVVLWVVAVLNGLLHYFELI